MSDFFPVYIYFGFVLLVVLTVLGLSALILSNKTSKTKFMPYESGIQTDTRLLQERFTLRHYLVALMFLVFDIEVVFLYPWAVVGKKIGAFAFYEMAFFMAALVVGFAYVWRKGGFQWNESARKNAVFSCSARKTSELGASEFAVAGSVWVGLLRDRNDVDRG